MPRSGRVGIEAGNAYARDCDDGYSQAANPALGAERIDALEAVVGHRIGRDLALRQKAFDQDGPGVRIRLSKTF